MLEKIAEIITNLVERNMDLTEKEIARINYGLQLIIGVLFQLMVIFIISLYLQIFWYVFIASLTFLLLRIYANGFHLPTYRSCFIFSLVEFIAIGILAKNIVLSRTGLIIWLVLVTGISIYLLYKYAPADTKKVPIEDPVTRKRYQRNSLLITLVWFIISLLLLFADFKLSYLFSGSLGILLESFATIPYFFTLVDNLFPAHE